IAVVTICLGSVQCFAQGEAIVSEDQSASSTAGIQPAPSINQPDAELLRELESMRARIAELEARIRNQAAPSSASVAPANEMSSVGPASPVSNSTVSTTQPPVTQDAQSSPQTKPAKAEPFAFADWTWLNGNPRTKDIPFDSKFFTPEVRADIAYHYD